MEIREHSFLGHGTFITYPHCNGFADGGKALVYLQILNGERTLYLRDITSKKSSPLAKLSPSNHKVGTWDVAFESGDKLAMIAEGRACILDLRNPKGFDCVYVPDAGAKLDSLCSLSRDGSRLLCSEKRGQLYTALEIDLKTREVRRLFSKSWYANHFHYCPYDDHWVAFSHEGQTEEIPDRCWVWHADQAPEGRCVFNQASEKPGTLLCVGHERWSFHDISAYVIAYAHSPVGKRGLYEVFGDGRPARLLWESDLLWHCTMDPTGRFVAVDTTGPFREEPLSKEAYRKYLNRHVQTDREHGTIESDVVVLDLKTGKSLYLGTAMRSMHPHHPHPAISPDLRSVVWNDFNPDSKGVRVAAVSLE